MATVIDLVRKHTKTKQKQKQKQKGATLKTKSGLKKILATGTTGDKQKANKARISNKL